MLSQRSSSGMQERWAVLLREEPSSKDYREAVSSNVAFAQLLIVGVEASRVYWQPDWHGGRVAARRGGGTGCEGLPDCDR